MRLLGGRYTPKAHKPLSPRSTEVRDRLVGAYNPFQRAWCTDYLYSIMLCMYVHSDWSNVFVRFALSPFAITSVSSVLYGLEERSRKFDAQE